MASEPQPLPARPSGAPTLVLELSLKGQHLETRRFDRDQVMIGRHPHCDLWIDNPGVSRQHLRIARLAGGEYQVDDLGSANGTFLNDKPVRVATLRNGDVLQFSKYTLRVGIEGAPLVAVRSQERGRSQGDGATVMLSPTELRELLQEARGEAAPAAALTTRDPAPVPAATAAAPSATRTGRNIWPLIAFVALIAALAVALVIIGR